jgi:hypothetical protein
MIYPAIETLIQTHFLSPELIRDERKKELDELAIWIGGQLELHKQLDCIIICTHNSRRSHLGQVMLALAANYYKVNGLSAFSGGTEATAFNSRMVNAMIDVGFDIQMTQDCNNPVYDLKWGDEKNQQLNSIFSKNYANEVNPQKNFLAILVCDSADKNCPVVLGASKRIALPYQDPKDFDDTAEEKEAYRTKIYEMGNEFFYLASKTPSRS